MYPGVLVCVDNQKVEELSTRLKLLEAEREVWSNERKKYESTIKYLMQELEKERMNSKKRPREEWQSLLVQNSPYSGNYKHLVSNIDHTVLLSTKANSKSSIITYLIETQTFKESLFNIHDGSIFGISPSPYDPYICSSASQDKTMCILNFNSEAIVLRVPLKCAAYSTCFDSFNPNLIYAGLQNNTICVFDIRNSQNPIHTLEQDSSMKTPIVSVLHADKKLFSVSFKSIYCFDETLSKKCMIPESSKTVCFTARVLQNGSLAACYRKNSIIGFYSKEKEITTNFESVTKLGFAFWENLNTQYLAIPNNQQQQIYIYNESGTIVDKLSFSKAEVNDVCVLKQKLFAISNSGQIIPFEKT